MTIVCLGDSITFGYGVPAKSGWVSLAQMESGHEMINAGISGDTTGGMLSRFDRDVLSQKPDAVMLLGGINDLIAGCGAGPIRSNVTAMAQQAVARSMRVLIGTLPPVYPPYLPAEWLPTFQLWAGEQEYQLYQSWLPVFAEGFHCSLVDFYRSFQCQAAAPESYLFDGLHPNQSGHRIMKDAFLSALENGNIPRVRELP
jgi:acyl-CoA thioesterase-1